MEYRSVYELTDDELYELKEKLFYGCHENGNLDLEERAEVEAVQYAEDISCGIVYSAFSGYNFVKEDFFCNCDKED